MKIRYYSASPGLRINLLRCSQSIPIRSTRRGSSICVLSAYVTPYPFTYGCRSAASFLPSGSGPSGQSRTALPEHSRAVMVPGTSGNGCGTSGNGYGTSGNGCWHLWALEQTQSLPSAPQAARAGASDWKESFGCPALGENSACGKEADANIGRNEVDNPHKGVI